MSIQKRALLLRNQFGFKIAAKVYEDGSFSVRLFNFIKQPTNANTLPEAEAIKLRDFLNESYPKREPVLARPEHSCSVEEAMALTMERYGQPGGALEQLAALERGEILGRPARKVHIHLPGDVRAVKVTARIEEQRECCNAECGWKGITDRVLSGHGNVPDVGPLCPECGETTELAELDPNPPKEPVVLREYQELERDTGRLIVRPAPPTELACGKCNRAPSEIAVCQHWECGVYSREVTK